MLGLLIGLLFVTIPLPMTMLATVRTDVCIQLLLCLPSCIALRLRFATTFVRAFALSRILTFAFTFAIRAFALSKLPMAAIELLP